MGNISKTFASILILIVAISCVGLLLVKPITAQRAIPTPFIPTPSVPQFTVKYVDSSYEVPASTSINQFTGQEVGSIVITITNQPFTPYPIDNYGHSVTLLYNVRMKGQDTDVWTNLYHSLEDYPVFSSSEYTVLTFPVNTNAKNSLTIPDGSRVDFQVQAMIGYGQVDNPSIFYGNTSDWSPTQTLTIPAANLPTPSPTLSPTPTSTPIVPEFPALIVLLLLLSILCVAVISRHRKNR